MRRWGLGCGASVKTPPCGQSAPVNAELEQRVPACARATNSSELRRSAYARGALTGPSSAFGSGARCDSKQEARSEVTKRAHLWGLTFDMSGGPKGAKRPLERPLDGGVRPQRATGLHGLRYRSERCPRAAWTKSHRATPRKPATATAKLHSAT